MSAERQRLRPWLEEKINSGKVHGLRWRNQEIKEFRVSWKHAGKPDFVAEKDAMLFKLWAEHTGKYRQGESPDPSTWKTRFRCALHKMPDVEEVRVPHSLDEKEPYRVFRFKEKAGSSPKRSSISPKSDENQNGKRPMCRQKNDSVIRTAPPAKLKAELPDNVFFNNYPVMSGPQGYGGRQDSPQNDSSDDSMEDDLRNITPTIPPYPNHAYESMLTDDPLCGHSANPFLPYTNGHGFLNCNGDFPVSNGFIKQFPPAFDSLDLSNIRKEILEAFFAANGQLANGSIFGENGQAFLQHVMATNPAMMKLWMQGVVIPDESSDVSTSANTHLNMDNGLIEPTGMGMDDNVGRTVTIPHLNDNAASIFSRTGKSTGDSCDTAMHIRVFYGNCEVLSTDSRLTESERVIRISHGSPVVEPGQYELALLCKVFGPPTARQIELPLFNHSSKDTMKVMNYLTRGILLEINEVHDIFVTRLCPTRVFYSNRKSAKKLEREQRTKVFDYQSKFLPALKESRNGDREYPSYEVTLYLGRADSSLVSIVITHAMAKMSLHNASTAGENFWSEPNENDRFATNLEEDCFY